jgi:hypothetical protein
MNKTKNERGGVEKQRKIERVKHFEETIIIHYNLRLDKNTQHFIMI